MTRTMLLCSLALLLPALLLPAPALLAADPVQMPTPRHSAAPADAPSLPDAFDPYDPPTAADVKVDDDAPGISQWTRTAGADEHVIVAGYNLEPKRKRTRFHVFAQTREGAVRGLAQVVHLEDYQAIVRLPKDLPANAMILLAPENAKGVGQPVAVNQTELWYVLPRTANPGGELSLYGRNLSGGAEGKQAWVLLKRKGEDAPGVLLTAKAANPYKADFALPADLPTGSYEVWAHNGRGGTYGWSPLHGGQGGPHAPTELKVAASRAWDGPVLDVTKFGAKGDDDADDTEAVLKALTEANQAKNATVHFPAGTYYLSEAFGPVHGPEESGMRIRGEGMDKTFVKSNPQKVPNTLLHITGGGVEVRDMTWDYNALGEAKKFYRNADRGEHNPKHYAYLEKVKASRDAIKAWEKRKENKGKTAPASMQPPASPKFPDVEARRALVSPPTPIDGKRRAFIKEGWKGDIRFINCTLDAERQIISMNGLVDSVFENCDIVARECQLGCPQFTTIRGCNFFGRADAAVLMYMYGGWCYSVTECTGQDYMPNTYDTCMGRFFTVSAYGNRHESVYVGENRTKDLTVQPMHFNQNSGEQIMWEFMPIHSTQTPARVDGQTLTFADPIKGKVAWYSDAIVVAGKGLGQYRKIDTYDEATRTVTLSAPWDVAPDTSSTIAIGQPIRRVVVHGNSLDAKPRAAASEQHIASAGVEPFGSSLELIVDNNTFHELRSGIATFDLALFHYYAHNRFESVRTGAVWGNGTGFTVRRNTLDGAIEHGYQVRGSGRQDASVLEVIEHDTARDLPVAVRLGDRYNKPLAQRVLVLYRDVFERGKASRVGSVGIMTPDPDLVQQDATRLEGFEKKLAPPPSKK